MRLKGKMALDNLGNKIAIITDSACDLSSEYIKEHNVNVLPLRITYEDREYQDGVDITPSEVYENLGKEIPKTSLPNVGDAKDLIDKLKSQGYTHILAIHLSSGLSGTYSMMKNLADEATDIVMDVIDSNSLTLGLGYCVMEAAKMIENNFNFSAIAEKVKAMPSKIKGYYVIKTLEYLKKGGRIGYVSATIGELLDIKPIISINDEGKYYIYSKARGRKQSLNKLYDIVVEGVKDKVSNVAVLHGGAYEEMMQLVEKVKELKNVKEIVTGFISPALGVHTGAGLVAVVICEV
jgi:DegV family protein with EDD domain